MGVIIRRAIASDVDALTACIKAAYAGYAAEGLSLPDVTGGLADDIRDHHVWIAEEAGEMLGGVVLTMAGRAAKLANLAVHPDHGGQGVGKRLIQTVLTAAHDSDCTTIGLVTHAAMPANIALYERLGWAVVTRDGDKVVMSRPV